MRPFRIKDFNFSNESGFHPERRIAAFAGANRDRHNRDRHNRDR
jgi:hypothetical protein